MRQLIVTFTLSIFILSCGQYGNKEKILELKEKELALKEKELTLLEKSISSNDSSTQHTPQKTKNPTPNSRVNIANQQKAINTPEAAFLGCWNWGDKKSGDLIILEVRQKGILIIHRFDIYVDEEVKQNAGYKIVGNKILFTNNRLLMPNKYHIEKIQNETFLVEEYPDEPNKFKKINCK